MHGLMPDDLSAYERAISELATQNRVRPIAFDVAGRHRAIGFVYPLPIAQGSMLMWVDSCAVWLTVRPGSEAHQDFSPSRAPLVLFASEEFVIGSAIYLADRSAALNALSDRTGVTGVSWSDTQSTDGFAFARGLRQPDTDPRFARRSGSGTLSWRRTTPPGSTPGAGRTAAQP